MPLVYNFNISKLSFYKYLSFKSIWIHGVNKIISIMNQLNHINSSWPHAFARIIARERRASHGPKSHAYWSPREPARVQPPFPQDIWTLSSSVIRLALIGTGVLARIWSIQITNMANWIVILLYVYFSLLRKQLTYKRLNVNVHNS